MTAACARPRSLGPTIGVLALAGCFVAPPADDPTSTTGGSTMATTAGPDTTGATATTATTTSVPTSDDSGAPDGSSTDGANSDTDTTGTASSSSDSGGESTGVVSEDPDQIGWYRFEDITPPTIVDSSMFGLDGTCGVDTCPQTATGVIGEAADFQDGQQQAVIVNHDDAHITDEALTLAAWVQMTATSTQTGVIVSKPFGSDGDDNSWQLNITSALRPQVGFHGDGIQQLETLDTPIAIGTWVHFALTWDGLLVGIWIDGVEMGQLAALTLDLDENPITIGADINNGSVGNYLPGLVDEVRIYRRALTAGEIALLATDR